MFRRQQEEADRIMLSQVDNADDKTAVGTAHDLGTSESQWAINARKKRKRVEKEGLKGVQLRKGSFPVDVPEFVPSETTLTTIRPEEKSEAIRECVADGKSPSYPKPLDDRVHKPLSVRDNDLQPSLGLAAYSSDEEED